METFVVCANIDHYLGVLSTVDLSQQNRATVMKLLIEEEDKLSHDLEQLQFAESRFIRSQDRVYHLRKLRDGFADGSADRARAERLLATYEVTHRLTVQFYQRMRQKVDGQGM